MRHRCGTWLERVEEERQAARQRARYIAYAEEDARRERERTLAYEIEDRYHKRWYRLTAEIGAGLVAIATVVGVVLTVVFFNEEAADRHDARMVSAWRLLKDSAGVDGNIGQVAALEALYRGNQNLQEIYLYKTYLYQAALIRTDVPSRVFRLRRLSRVVE